jgi:hypothetical protein
MGLLDRRFEDGRRRPPLRLPNRVTHPAATLAGSLVMIAIIGSWLIMASPASLSVTSTFTPPRCGTEYEAEPTALSIVRPVELLTRATNAVTPTARASTAPHDAMIAARRVIPMASLDRLPGGELGGGSTCRSRSHHGRGVRRGSGAGLGRHWRSVIGFLRGADYLAGE